MSSNINFNDMWAQQKTSEPNQEKLFSKVDQLKGKYLKKLILTNVLLVTTSLFIIIIWFYYQPQMITTKIGIVLVILAMVIFIFLNNKSLNLFKKENVAESNRQYLKDLLAIKEKQTFMQTTVLNIYFIILSTGLALYMYEYVSRMTGFWAAFSYGITAVWILFNWFYLRPRQIKKQNTKLNEMIVKFEKIEMQLKEF